MVRVARTGQIVAAFFVALAFARPVSGQNAPPAEREKVRLLYEAPDSCTGREQFLPQVRARLGTDWEASPGELARTIHVRVSLTGERYVARIELQDARGRQVARAVAGTRCEQVIEGIALVTVLAIEAQLEELMGQSEPASDDAAPPAAPPPAPAATEPTTPTPPARPASKKPSPSADESRLALRLGARAVLQQGVGPEVATGAGAFVALAWPNLVLGLAVDVVGTGQVDAKVVPARFDLLAARLDVCGHLPTPASALSVEPCLFFQAGSLEARGQAAPPAVTRGTGGTAAWLVPGALLAVRAELGPVSFGLEGSAGISADPEGFYLARGEGRDVVYEVPWLVTSAALSVGVRF